MEIFIKSYTLEEKIVILELIGNKQDKSRGAGRKGT